MPVQQAHGRFHSMQCFVPPGSRDDDASRGEPALRSAPGAAHLASARLENHRVAYRAVREESLQQEPPSMSGESRSWQRLRRR